MPPDSTYERLRLVARDADDHADMPEPPAPDPSDPGPAEPLPCQPYRVLGHDRGMFYFLTTAGGQILSFAGRDLSRDAVLMQLAPIFFWEHNYPSKQGANYKAAANEIIQTAYRVGIYDPDRLRGRGAWIDDGRAVLHMGDRLLVDRRESDLDLEHSKFVYEAARPLSLTIAPPLTNHEANRLAKLCCRFSWEKPVSGTLLAGWIAIAPICGALKWRPSVWLTGGSGSGKTTVQNSVVIPALGGMALAVQSKTSEAGIRQRLGSDARPVVFDEAEREDQDAARRMQAVLDLARQSSSEGGAEIIKGTATQAGARSYRVRSCFMFSSINVGLVHHADENRVTVLALSRPRMTDDQFAELERDIADLLTPDFAAGLLARSVSMLAVIRDNAETFARAVSAHLGSRRAGDQLGALLAGAYSLHSTQTISMDAATAYVARHQWTDTPIEDPADSDEFRLLAHLMQHRVRVGSGNRAPFETTIGMLIQASSRSGGVVPCEQADAALRLVGIRYEVFPAGFYVANRHPDLAGVFHETPWSAGWHRTLSRIPTATNADNKSVRFGPGVVSKSVFLPIEVLGLDQEPLPDNSE